MKDFLKILGQFLSVISIACFFIILRFWVTKDQEYKQFFYPMGYIIWVLSIVVGGYVSLTMRKNKISLLLSKVTWIVTKISICLLGFTGLMKFISSTM